MMIARAILLGLSLLATVPAIGQTRNPPPQTFGPNSQAFGAVTCAPGRVCDISGLSAAPSGSASAPLSTLLKNLPKVDPSGNLTILNGPTLGTYQNGQFTSQPYALQIGAGGATGPVDGATATATGASQGQTLGGWFSSVVFGTPTVATLRAYNRLFVAPGSVLYASGYYAANDGGGGSFIWSSTSTASDDGVLVFNPTGNGGAGRWLRIPSGPMYWRMAGAKCDGIADDAAPIRAAIAAARAFGTTYVPGPVGTCLIGSTISAADWSNIIFEGQGAGSGAGSNTNAQDGTVLKWTGAAGGRMLDWQSPSATRPYLNSSAVIRAITLDGNGTAGTGLYARGLYNCRVAIKVRNITQIGVDIDIYQGGGADVQQCVSDYINVDLGYTNSYNAKGIVLGAGSSYNNIHHNTWGGWSVILQAGTGIEIGNADSNIFIRPQAQYPVDGSGTRTGVGLDLRASPNALGPGGVTQAARDNTFVGASIAAGTYARAGSFGFPSYGNMMVGFVQGSNEPSPVIEAGARLDWFSSTGEWHLSKIYPNQQIWKSPGDFDVLFQNQSGATVGYFGTDGVISGVPTDALRIRGTSGVAISASATASILVSSAGYVTFPQIGAYASNSAAASAGVPVGALFYNSGSGSLSLRQ